MPSRVSLRRDVASALALSHQVLDDSKHRGAVEYGLVHVLQSETEREDRQDFERSSISLGAPCRSAAQRSLAHEINLP